MLTKVDTECHELPQNTQSSEKKTSQQSNRYLATKQMQAIDELLLGKSITDTALVVGVSRETLSRWKNSNPNFIAEFNRRQQCNIEASSLRLRNLVGKAVDVLEGSLKAGNLKAAVELLKIVNLYGKVPEPSKEVDAEMILARKAEEIAVTEVAKRPFGGKPETIKEYPSDFVKVLAQDIYQMKKAAYNVPSMIDEIISKNEDMGGTPKGEDLQ